MTSFANEFAHIEKSTHRICPFDKNHKIRANYFQYHICKCAKKHPNHGLSVCPYNSTHYLSKDKFEAHVKHECPDRYISDGCTSGKSVNVKTKMTLDKWSAHTYFESESSEEETGWETTPISRPSAKSMGNKTKADFKVSDGSSKMYSGYNKTSSDIDDSIRFPKDLEQEESSRGKSFGRILNQEPALNSDEDYGYNRSQCPSNRIDSTFEKSFERDSSTASTVSNSIDEELDSDSIANEPKNNCYKSNFSIDKSIEAEYDTDFSVDEPIFKAGNRNHFSNSKTFEREYDTDFSIDEPIFKTANRNRFSNDKTSEKVYDSDSSFDKPICKAGNRNHFTNDKRFEKAYDSDSSIDEPLDHVKKSSEKDYFEESDFIVGESFKRDFNEGTVNDNHLDNYDSCKMNPAECDYEDEDFCKVESKEDVDGKVNFSGERSNANDYPENYPGSERSKSDENSTEDEFDGQNRSQKECINGNGSSDYDEDDWFPTHSTLNVDETDYGDDDWLSSHSTLDVDRSDYGKDDWLPSCSTTDEDGSDFCENDWLPSCSTTDVDGSDCDEEKFVRNNFIEENSDEHISYDADSDKYYCNEQNTSEGDPDEEDSNEYDSNEQNAYEYDSKDEHSNECVSIEQNPYENGSDEQNFSEGGSNEEDSDKYDSNEQNAYEYDSKDEHSNECVSIEQNPYENDSDEQNFSEGGSNEEDSDEYDSDEQYSCERHSNEEDSSECIEQNPYENDSNEQKFNEDDANERKSNKNSESMKEFSSDDHFNNDDLDVKCLEENTTNEDLKFQKNINIDTSVSQNSPEEDIATASSNSSDKSQEKPVPKRQLFSECHSQREPQNDSDMKVDISYLDKKLEERKKKSLRGPKKEKQEKLTIIDEDAFQNEADTFESILESDEIEKKDRAIAESKGRGLLRYLNKLKYMDSENDCEVLEPAS
ncbi:DgyrCDS4894 [Dimorphilus gyrociliatus]|uniref:DgyrCDS4894 n=1 Tax=Dimorphilus gyrociliatus TaxID=2664684 RepID=A0A7I8VID0_9ANNE|nr:DgyrCDS4894 [Dimorphilus gyrociliatus]